METQWARIDRRRMAVQAPPITIAFALRSRCGTRRPYGVVGDLNALKRRPHGVITALLSERRMSAFVLSMHKMRAVAQRSMRP